MACALIYRLRGRHDCINAPKKRTPQSTNCGDPNLAILHTFIVSIGVPAKKAGDGKSVQTPHGGGGGGS